MYSTNNKRLLIDLFKDNEEKVFKASNLIETLKDKMNKATIYRQLKQLEDEKIIRKSYNDEDNSYEYQYSSYCNNHLHLKCKLCGKIIHLKCNDANTFISHVLSIHGFSIDSYSTSILGICKECLGHA
ncbi:MAG: transcriptional repressor [Anaeroplasma sp.]|nr:transcriptional repressor [Anaeroplasma sp.]